MAEGHRPPSGVRRRDGVVVAFDRSRIERAVRRAAREVGREGVDSVRTVTDAVLEDLAASVGDGVAGVEGIQDAVERALVATGLHDVARAYGLYRRDRAELRAAKTLLGVRDELKLSAHAVAVLGARYLRRDGHGRVVESTGGMMDRVAGHVAGAERTRGDRERWAGAFSAMLRSLDFLPNSPTLMNAGTDLGLLSGCVVLPLEDSLRSIFGTLGQAALVHQAGGGTGFSFSHVRPAGDRVATTQGRASGPVSFIGVFDAAADVIRRGGRRRGASMAVLDVSHPDVREFVEAKTTGGRLENFNLSVAVPDRFMRAVAAGGIHRLVNPRTGRTAARVGARQLFDLICDAAARTGDPGLLFVGAINRANPLPSLGRIEATNPCGEVPLLPYESCNLGSINLARFVVGGRIDRARLTETVRTAVRFLDDVIDVSRYPFPELERAALAGRKVGLGVMGLAELLAAIGVPYDSDDALRVASSVVRRIRDDARRCSAELAEERGPFPLFPESRYAARGVAPLRNAQLTSVAPTGTISLIAGTTAGIEPMFAVAYLRHALGRHVVEMNPLFERVARDRGFWSESLLGEIARTGGVRASRLVPRDVRAAFVTALEISPSWHLRMQAAVQRHVDAAVSKTVNLSSDATVDDVASVYQAAWRAGAKGITVYRYGAKPDQVLTLLGGQRTAGAPPVIVDAEFAGGCAGHVCEF